MRALLDVNVLIALLDAEHSLHGRATEWIRLNARKGWASSPITQNGCIRIMSSPGYPNPLPVRSIIERLSEATASEFHDFWPDEVSLLDPEVCVPQQIHGPRQVTDLYLLALAVRNQGLFATFEQSIAVDAVRGATAGSLVVL